MHEQRLSSASRARRSRFPRRLLSVILGAALAGGMLAAVPAQAASGGGLVQIVSPADGADIHASTVPVTIRLRPGARPPTLEVLLNFRDVAARFHRHGHIAHAVLTPKDGLVDGSNVLIARITGPAGARSAAQVIFRAGGLLGAQASLPPTFQLQTRVVTQGQPGPGDHFEVLVGDTAYQAPPLTASTASCGNGVWVLALHRGHSIHVLGEDSSVDKPLCKPDDARALGAYLASLPNNDMVIVNSLSHDAPSKPVSGLGEALANIGAVSAEFDQLGQGGSYSVWGIPGLPAGQAYQAGDTWASEQQVPAGHATAASINSTLVQDNNQNYTLDMRDYVTFSVGGGSDLNSQGNITVGGQTYRPDGQVVSHLATLQASGQVVGAFHVLILDRRTLGVLSNQTYATAEGADAPGQEAMAGDLAQAAQNLRESALVLVASLGNPLANGQAQELTEPTIAQALAPFGGTPDVINSGASHADASNWPYALVGALSPPADYGLHRIDAPEASPTIHDGATGELDGVLQRGIRGMWYSPAGWNAPYIFDINGQTQVTTQNYGLYQAIGQAPTPWPVPVPDGQPDHAGELAAYQYLSDQACSGCHQDLRSYYVSDEKVIQTWRDIINSATNPGTYRNPDTGVTTTISQAEFDAVQGELGCEVDNTPRCGRFGELTDVLLVDGLRDDMHALLTDSNALAQSTLNETYKNVAATISLPSISKVGSALYDILELVQALVDIAFLGAPQHAPGEEEPEENGISEAIGLVAAIMGAANDLTDDPSGALKDQLQTTTDNLGQQAANDFAAGLTGLNETFGEIVSDWGRLSAVANGISMDPGNWDVSANEGQIVTAMTNAMKIGYYKALIPVVYQADEGQALPSSDAAKWCAPPSSGFTSGCPFTHYVPSTSVYSYPVNNPANSYAPAFDVTVVGQKPIITVNNLNKEVGGTPFSADLMNDIKDAGYYPGWFFQRFPLTRFVCSPSQAAPDPDDCGS